MTADSQCCQPFGEELGRRVLRGPGDFAELVPGGRGPGRAALLMSGDGIGGHRQGIRCGWRQSAAGGRWGIGWVASSSTCRSWFGRAGRHTSLAPTVPMTGRALALRSVVGQVSSPCRALGIGQYAPSIGGASPRHLYHLAVLQHADDLSVTVVVWFVVQIRIGVHCCRLLRCRRTLPLVVRAVQLPRGSVPGPRIPQVDRYRGPGRGAVRDAVIAYCAVKSAVPLLSFQVMWTVMLRPSMLPLAYRDRPFVPLGGTVTTPGPVLTDWR